MEDTAMLMDDMRETVTAFANTLEPEQLFLARIGVAAFFVLASLYGGRVIRPIIRFFGRRVKLRLPEWLHMLVNGFTEPIEYCIRILLLYAGVLVIPFPEEWTQLIFTWMTPAMRAVTVLLIAWGLWRASPLCRKLLYSAENRLDMNTNRTLGHFFENIYRLIVAGFAVLIVLDMLGVPVVSLVAGAGVVGLAISLAAQGTLTNLIAGITLVLEHPFGIGDFITLGDFSGTVEVITFRSTRIRTPDNVLVTVENSKVCSEYIQNGTKRESRLWTFTMRLPYELPSGRVEELSEKVRGIFENDPGIKDDPLVVTVDEIGEDGVKLLVRAYSTTADYIEYLHIRDRVNREVLSLLEQEGCAFAYPPSAVYMNEHKKPAD